MSFKVGFIGLGHMGFPMAKNLLASKLVDSLYVFDLVNEPMKLLADEGALKASNIKELAINCDVIFTMLQTGDQVTSICLNDDGIFKNCKSNTLHIDCSSIDVISSRNLHQQAKKFDIQTLDAPVSGGVKGAMQASLTIMVGGQESTFEKAKPILSDLGKNVIYAGGAGNGQVAKICNNMILGVSMIAVSEAFNLGEKLGLNPKNFFEIASRGSGECWSLTKYCPSPGILPDVPSSNDYMPGFTAQMMLKDLKLSQSAADANSIKTPMGAAATSLYTSFVNDNHAEEDFSAIIRFLDDGYK